MTSHSGAAGQLVGAAEAGKDVVARAAIEAVGKPVTGQRVAAGIAGEIPAAGVRIGLGR